MVVKAAVAKSWRACTSYRDHLDMYPGKLVLEQHFLHLVQARRARPRSEVESSMVSVPKRRREVTDPEQPAMLWLLQPASLVYFLSFVRMS